LQEESGLQAGASLKKKQMAREEVMELGTKILPGSQLSRDTARRREEANKENESENGFEKKR
jgi:hypothetical protein